MGRAGGGGGGGHSSGGSHSFSSSRSGSSHSFSRSSGRAGGSSFSSGHRSGYVGYSRGPSGGYSRGWYGGPSRTYVYGGGGHLSLGKLMVGMFLLFMFFTIVASLLNNATSSIPENTTNREKLELGYGYTNNTLTDEIGWIKNPGQLNRNLKDFYDATGIVPYIALVYRPEIPAGSPSQYDYAEQWYTDNLTHEGYMLLMYFSTGQEESAGVDGECVLICGKQAAAVMDEEAQSIFWAYLDRYWFSDYDEDTLFASTFQQTAKHIMQRSTSGFDVMKLIVVAMILLVVVLGVLTIMKTRRKHEAERAAETERILSHPLSGPASTADEDELLNQYEDDNT